MQHKATIFYEWEQGKSAYSFPFPYLSKQFVKVRVDHANASTLLEYNRDYTIEGQTLTLTPVQPFVSGATLCIYRQTPTGSLVDFSDGSLLLASEMDRLSTQLLHVEEENSDLIASTGMFADDDNAWQGQGRRIKNLSDPQNSQDAVTLNYLDSIGVARQSELQRVEELVTESARRSSESAKQSEVAAAESAQQFSAQINQKFQELTAQLLQKLSSDYVPQEQANEMRKDIANAGIAILRRNHAYQVGDIAYHKTLPSWARLECVKAGTTGATLQDLSGVHLGDKMTDGTVIWQVTKSVSTNGDMEAETQPVTVGWVKSKFQDLLKNALHLSGVRWNLESSVSGGYIYFGKLFGGLIIEFVYFNTNNSDNNNEQEKPLPLALNSLFYGNLNVFSTEHTAVPMVYVGLTPDKGRIRVKFSVGREKSAPVYGIIIGTI